MRSVKAYRYRWVILLSLVLLIISVESQWLTVAPVGRVANTFYRGQLNLRHSTPVDLLSLMYLVVFVVASVPSSYLLHRLGIRWVVWIASGTIIFRALTKTLYLADLRFVLFGQFFLAVGQTLVLVSITEIVSRWFPIRERGMAVGLTSTSQYLSLAMVMIVTPLWVGTKSSDPMWGSGFERMMRFWGIFSAILALVPAFLIRENPPDPLVTLHLPGSELSLELQGLLAQLVAEGLLVIFSICWGVLMVFFIKVDQISALLGITDSNGILGISMFVGGHGRGDGPAGALRPLSTHQTLLRLLYRLFDPRYPLDGLLRPDRLTPLESRPSRSSAPRSSASRSCRNPHRH